MACVDLSMVSSPERFLGTCLSLSSEFEVLGAFWKSDIYLRSLIFWVFYLVSLDFWVHMLVWQGSLDIMTLYCNCWEKTHKLLEEKIPHILQKDTQCAPKISPNNLVTSLQPLCFCTLKKKLISH